MIIYRGLSLLQTKCSGDHLTASETSLSDSCIWQFVSLRRETVWKCAPLSPITVQTQSCWTDSRRPREAARRNRGWQAVRFTSTIYPSPQTLFQQVCWKQTERFHTGRLVWIWKLISTVFPVHLKVVVPARWVSRVHICGLFSKKTREIKGYSLTIYGQYTNILHFCTRQQVAATLCV